jgi:hypothetical protein
MYIELVKDGVCLLVQSVHGCMFGRLICTISYWIISEFMIVSFEHRANDVCTIGSILEDSLSSL